MKGDNVTMEGKFLDYINKTRNANSEDDIDELLRIMNPTDDRDEMGRVYEDVLGYNPLQYFDENALRSLLEEVTTYAPASVVTIIKNSKEQIISKALQELKVLAEESIVAALISALDIETGWVPEVLIRNASTSLPMLKAGFTIDEDESFDDDEENDADDDNDEDDYVGISDEDDD